MNNIDPYNNAPPSRGTCGAKPSLGGPPPGLEQMPGIPYQPQQMQYPDLHLPTGPGGPGGASQLQYPDLHQGHSAMTTSLEQENQRLRSDLENAIQYIQQLGGSWPPRY
jgi:hypothetical protein